MSSPWHWCSQAPFRIYGNCLKPLAACVQKSNPIYFLAVSRLRHSLGHVVHTGCMPQPVNIWTEIKWNCSCYADVPFVVWKGPYVPHSVSNCSFDLRKFRWCECFTVITVSVTCCDRLISAFHPYHKLHHHHSIFPSIFPPIYIYIHTHSMYRGKNLFPFFPTLFF